MASAETSEALLTAEQIAERPDPGYPEELVRGRIVKTTTPSPRHGEICAQVVYLLRRYLEDHDIGRVLSNDSGVIVERDPDTVRGADVAFYSYARVPKGPLPRRYLDVVPELVFEVLSPGDRLPNVLRKVIEYLEAGVSFVAVLDEVRQSVHLFGVDGTDRILGSDDELTLPEVLGEFRVAAGRFFG